MPTDVVQPRTEYGAAEILFLIRLHLICYLVSGGRQNHNSLLNAPVKKGQGHQIR
jgi:hypothetical protein